MAQVNQEQQISRDAVFIAGGQPTVTYVDRVHLKIEESLSQALNVPNQTVSLAGPTKSGKTVLCRTVVGNSPYVWIEGGQMETAKELWDKCCYVLNYPIRNCRRPHSSLDDMTPDQAYFEPLSIRLAA
jgi:hypothetical protein